MDDVTLFEAWVLGDRARGNQLMQRYYARVYTFFHLRVTHLADDLTQATFLACVEARDRLRSLPSFRAFLFGIARHQLLNHLRSRRRETAALELASLLDLDTTLSASRIVATREEHRLLLRALQVLPVEDQLALDMQYWQDMSTREIAAVLEIPQSTVTTRVARLRAELRDAVAGLRAAEAPRASLLSDLEGWVRSLAKPPTA